MHSDDSGYLTITIAGGTQPMRIIIVPPANERVTEDDEARITEDGEDRIIE